MARPEPIADRDGVSPRDLSLAEGGKPVSG